MARLQRGILRLFGAVGALAAILIALTLLTALFEAVVPWERAPWGGVEASGRVVAHEPYSANLTHVYPVVTFTTATDEHRFVDGSPHRASLYPVGAAVTILYDPADPSGARIGSYEDLAYAAAAAVVVALIVVVGVARALRRR